MEQKKFNILVTGALGSLGKPLWEELRKGGHTVLGCDLRHHEDPEYLRCDIREYRQLERIFQNNKFDFVYNLAAEFGRWNGEDFYENLWMTNVVGLKHILRLQEKHSFRLVHFSSSEVYGDWEEQMTEDVMEREEIKQLNDYALSKWTNEIQILNAQSQKGIKTLRVRIFNAYGPGEYYSPYRSALCRFIYSALKGSRFTVYRNHERSWLYISDATRTLARIVENFKTGEVYNIANPESYSMEKLAQLVLEVTGADSQLVIWKESEPFTTKQKKVDVSKSQRDFQHNPQVSLEEGIRKTVEWMKKVYDL